MENKKKQEKKAEENKEKGKTSKISCADKFCPLHGSQKLKLRGRIFEGAVIKKFLKRIVIQFERMHYIKKYERYEKRKTKLHARLPDCLREEINIGDLIQIMECRPLSKIIHFVVVKKIQKSGGLK